MNLVFRALITLFQAYWGGAKAQLFQPIQQNYRVWLHDLGWRDHLPNYRVFSFMELGRIKLWHQTGLANSGLYRMRAIAAQDYIYLRPIMPFQKFELTSELLCWDHKYFYYQHKLLLKGKLAGIGLVKEAHTKSGHLVLTETVLAAYQQKFAVTLPAQQLHPRVEQWLKSQKMAKELG